MAISYRGGLSTRPYEEVGFNLSSLTDALQRYNHHLDLLCSNTYDKFKTLKVDYDSGFIELSTYVQFLKIFKDHFDKHHDYNNPKMHRDEIQAELNKYCKW